MVIRVINKFLGIAGYTIQKRKLPENTLPSDIQSDRLFMSLYNKVKDYSMTSIERLYALHQAVLHVSARSLNGSFVECGVWKGGSSMMIALTLKELSIFDKEIYLYDTFEGMVEPTDDDKEFTGRPAADMLKEALLSSSENKWCYSALEEVRLNMSSTGYPAERIHYVKGKVEDTIPGVCPLKISLLRLDTDWYESTKHELIYLYPNLVEEGVLIIDDFGYWQGAKKAVLEYFKQFKTPPFLNRIDETGRLVIKE